MPITNQNPSMRALIPELMGGAATDPLVRQDPTRPSTTWVRPVQVTSDVRSTYVVPGDWPGKPDDWFVDGGTYKWRHQNNGEYLIDGEATYEAMAEAIDTATGPDHFIILLGWTIHVDFPLSKD